MFENQLTSHTLRFFCSILFIHKLKMDLLGIDVFFSHTKPTLNLELTAFSKI